MYELHNKKDWQLVLCESAKASKVVNEWKVEARRGKFVLMLGLFRRNSNKKPSEKSSATLFHIFQA